MDTLKEIVGFHVRFRGWQPRCVAPKQPELSELLQVLTPFLPVSWAAKMTIQGIQEDVWRREGHIYNKD